MRQNQIPAISAPPLEKPIYWVCLPRLDDYLKIPEIGPLKAPE